MEITSHGGAVRDRHCRASSASDAEIEVKMGTARAVKGTEDGKRWKNKRWLRWPRTLPRSGSRVRIPSPAPKFSTSLVSRGDQKGRRTLAPGLPADDRGLMTFDLASIPGS